MCTRLFSKCALPELLNGCTIKLVKTSDIFSMEPDLNKVSFHLTEKLTCKSCGCWRPQTARCSGRVSLMLSVFKILNNECCNLRIMNYISIHIAKYAGLVSSQMVVHVKLLSHCPMTRSW